MAMIGCLTIATSSAEATSKAATIVSQNDPNASNNLTVALVARSVDTASEKAATLVGSSMKRLLINNDEYTMVPIGEKLGAPGAARARLELAKLRQLVNDARHHFDALRLDECANTLEAAMQGYRQNAAHLHDISPAVDLLLLLGATERLRKRPKASGAAMHAALPLAPTASPDPTLYNPKLRARFEKLRDRLEKRALGTLTINSTPQNAEVFVNGRMVGVSPISLPKIAAGDHFIAVRKVGYATFGSVAKVHSDRETTLSARLAAAPSFGDFDNLLEDAALPIAAMLDSDKPYQSQAVPDALGQAAAFLDNDVFLWIQVRRDGETVIVDRLLADLNANNGAGSWRSHDHARFAYSEDPRHYAPLLETHFGTNISPKQTSKPTQAQAVEKHHAEPPPTTQMPRRTLASLTGKELTVLTTTLAAIVSSAAGSWYWDRAKTANQEYRGQGGFTAPSQNSSHARELRRRGQRDAKRGDLLIATSLLALSGSGALHYLWPTKTAPEKVTTKVVSLSPINATNPSFALIIGGTF